MRTMNHGHYATVVCALLVAVAANASEGCGQRELRDKSTAAVMLSPEKVFASGQPLFYLRYTNDVRVLYFRPEDVVAFLEEELAGLRAKYPSVTFSETGIPLDWIRQDLPLKEDTDLFKYGLRNPAFALDIDLLVADLLDKGQAAVDFLPLRIPHQEAGNKHDPNDPSSIKRIDWKTREEEGRIYCDAGGREIHKTVDVIIVGGSSSGSSPPGPAGP